MWELEINSRYDEFYDKLEEANRRDLLWKFDDIKKEIRTEIRDLEEEKQSIIKYSTYDNMMMDERNAIDDEISALEGLIEGANEYLTKDFIQTRRWYIFDKLNGIKYFDYEDEIVDNAKEYIESLDLDEDDRIGIGAEYIRDYTSFGMSEFICRKDAKSKFTFSDDIDRVNIRLSGFYLRTVEELLEVLNS